MTRARWRVTKPLRDRIRAGHPWVYDRALAPAPQVAVERGSPRPLAAGELVTLVDERGPIATAMADPASPLRARIMDLDPDASCGAAWASARAEAAAARRARDPLIADCTARRLVHGEADACPGLVIDVYVDTAVIVFDGPAAATFWRPLLPGVLAGLADGGVPCPHAWLRALDRLGMGYDS